MINCSRLLDQDSLRDIGVPCLISQLISPDDLDDVLYDNAFEAIYRIQLDPDVLLETWAREL